jgi:putative transposase
VKAVTGTFGVSRSNQHERRVMGARKRQRYGCCSTDKDYLPLLKEIVGEKPSYGYRRITTLLNRRLTVEGLERVNVKRIYRIMRVNELLLPKHTGKPRNPHTGVIRTERSNMRWCSDIMEIGCRNGERVRIAFSLDCCDREAMSYVATTGGIDGDMVRDLMLDSVQNRFNGADKTPEPIEWLSDNGSPYIAESTKAFGALLGLKVCTTAYRSPESNGMAEAFVKTFKRDYIGPHGAIDALSLMEALPEMFEDYNENAPHKGLKMLSPREYRRLQNKLEGCPV